MEFKKPLSEHQKRSLSNAITVLNNPIFSTLIKTLKKFILEGFFISKKCPAGIFFSKHLAW